VPDKKFCSRGTRKRFVLGTRVRRGAIPGWHSRGRKYTSSVMEKRKLNCEGLSRNWGNSRHRGEKGLAGGKHLGGDAGTSPRAAGGWLGGRGETQGMEYGPLRSEVGDFFKGK